MQRARTDLTAGEAALLGAAAAALGVGLEISDGQYNPWALVLVGVAMVTTLAAVAGRAPRIRVRTLELVLSVLVGQLALLFVRPTTMEVCSHPPSRLPFFVLIGGAVGGVCAACQEAGLW